MAIYESDYRGAHPDFYATVAKVRADLLWHNKNAFPGWVIALEGEARSVYLPIRPPALLWNAASSVLAEGNTCVNRRHWKLPLQSFAFFAFLSIYSTSSCLPLPYFTTVWLSLGLVIWNVVIPLPNINEIHTSSKIIVPSATWHRYRTFLGKIAAQHNPWEHWSQMKLTTPEGEDKGEAILDLLLHSQAAQRE